MLYIKKQSPNHQIQQELLRIRTSPEWSNIAEGNAKEMRAQFDKLDKGIIRESLLVEQHHLCAYCMRRIKNDGAKMRIEHWEPLSKNKRLALDYSNFLGVCHGGAGEAFSGNRLLCCDANKADKEELAIDPRNENMMKGIAFTKDGIIQFVDLGVYNAETLNKIRDDINITLRLNGKVDVTGNCVQDTATQIVKGRKDAWQQAEAIIRKLARDCALTSAALEREIQRIESGSIWVEYAGVILFRLRRKKRALVARGL